MFCLHICTLCTPNTCRGWRGHRIPWTLDLRMGCEPLCGIEPGPLQEHPVFSCPLLLAFETAVSEWIKEDVDFNCVHQFRIHWAWSKWKARSVRLVSGDTWRGLQWEETVWAVKGWKTSLWWFQYSGRTKKGEGPESLCCGWWSDEEAAVSWNSCEVFPLSCLMDERSLNANVEWCAIDGQC